jgi:hypothetical protein
MDLVSELATRIYEPPLSHLRESGRIADVSNVVCAAMLVVDFETEVAMNGIVDFIGNSTGRYGGETALALEMIGCPNAAAALREILAVAAAAGMTHEAIQAERSALQPFAITSFSTLHGSKWDAATGEIDTVFATIDMTSILTALETFIDDHSAIFQEALGDAA